MKMQKMEKEKFADQKSCSHKDIKILIRTKQWFGQLRYSQNHNKVKKQIAKVDSQQTEEMVCIAVPVHRHQYTTLGTDVECIWN